MDLRQSILDQTDVSLALAKHIISAQANNANVVFSPPSIHVILGLIAAGSSGPTRDQLLGFLKIKSAEDLNSLSAQLVSLVFADGWPLAGPRLSFANSVWVEQNLDFKPGFKKIVDTVYRATCSRVDFQTKADEARNEVNAWASKETNGLIKEILPPKSVDSSARLIFANAVYFKGAWNERFDASSTKEDEFFLLNGDSVQAPFMTSKKKQYIGEFDGFKVLALPYQQGEDKRRFSMYFFLPNAKDGLPSLVEEFGSTFGFIEQHLPCERVEVGEFRIPKFKITFGFEASKLFKGQGLVLPFIGGGLTEMVDDSFVGQDLFVSSVFHKSFIEVNEEGTEAAAVSACVVARKCLMININELEFVANHPFLFVIREDMTGVVLFIGQVLNPLG
ncbi:serpin-ZX-like [Henckelia pumila]|uniref:serpin-ZX-like n=1 Tax=Henckelia pumila TaxID=405737 RepID=UPI003C6E6FBD